VKLLVDHNLPPRLASALHIIFEPDHMIVALREKFGRSNLKDEDWIVSLGREGGWAVLSADRNIARKKPSRNLFVRAGLVGFFFSPAMQKWPLHRQCARMMTILPQMAAYMKLTANGVFEVPASGSKFRQLGR
jgi:hypothetical protein